MEDRYDALVIGGGAAGLSAALMLGRARRRTLVLDAGSPRNRFAAHMHGVLGHDGVDPAELLARGRAEVAAYGVEVRSGDVVRLDPVDGGDDDLAATLADGTAVRARAVLLATGVTDELPPIPGLAERWRVTVLHCPYCHGWEVRGRTIGVLATSAASLHQIELLRQWSDDVVAFVHAAGALPDDALARMRARGIRVVGERVDAVLGDGTDIEAVRTADGVLHGVDAIFTGGTLVPHDDAVAHLGLARAEGPTGSVLAVDQLGATSHPRIFAAGNVVVPFGNVPLSMGAGSMAGAGVNAMLVGVDARAAVAAESHGEATAGAAPDAYWEGLYARRRRWSGHANAALVDVVSPLEPGRALDLGCGEGGDVLWLAERGWHATGVDLAPTAIARATQAAQRAGVADRVHLEAADLETWEAEGDVDLVTASFLQSPVALDRAAILRRHARRVVQGGRVLVVAHAAVPSWAPQHATHEGAHELASPSAIVDELALGDGWVVEVAEVRTRPVVAPDGSDASLDDAVVLLRRVD